MVGNTFIESAKLTIACGACPNTYEVILSTGMKRTVRCPGCGVNETITLRKTALILE